MEISIPVTQGIDLKVADRLTEAKEYATSHLPIGFRMISGGKELVEEAVGFGFPVLKRGLQSLFPGKVELISEQHGSAWSIQSIFQLNLVEKIQQAENGSIENRLVYATKNSLAALIRHFPPIRGLLTSFSSGIRKTFGWRTTYERTNFKAEIKLIHHFKEGSGNVEVEVDTTSLPDGTSEVIVMNEQGAHYFDRYQDSNGVSVVGKKIGCWDQVTAQEARFICASHNVSFKLGKPDNARLYSGRELVGSRLAWAGFGYSLSPSIKKFNYQLVIERLI